VYGNFEVIPTEHFRVVSSGTLEPTRTTLAASDGELLVGTYNVLKRDMMDDAMAENAEIIATYMNGPDVVALQEIQNDSGLADDKSANNTLAALVAAISTINPTLQYQYIDYTFIGDNTNGGEPGDNIRTAYLYNPARVSVDMTSLNTVVNATDQKNPFLHSHLPLAATFTFINTGYIFEVINNHWSSKKDSAVYMGTAQPFEELQEDAAVNGGLVERKRQSAAIKRYTAGRDNVIVVGNFNEFEFVSPIASLGDDLTILTNNISENERYSSIYQGNSQALDHILVSAGIEAVAEYVHVNAEFAHRAAADFTHDPMVARIQVPDASPQWSPFKAPIGSSGVSPPGSPTTKSPAVAVTEPTRVSAPEPPTAGPTKSVVAIPPAEPIIDGSSGSSKPSMGAVVGFTLGGLAAALALAVVLSWRHRFRERTVLQSFPAPIPYPWPAPPVDVHPAHQ
jgi:endonuclease/exonuclease/phosphatase family metal-dependent hydrolase